MALTVVCIVQTSLLVKDNNYHRTLDGNIVHVSDVLFICNFSSANDSVGYLCADGMIIEEIPEAVPGWALIQICWNNHQTAS